MSMQKLVWMGCLALGLGFGGAAMVGCEEEPANDVGGEMEQLGEQMDEAAAETQEAAEEVGTELEEQAEDLQDTAN